MKKRLALASKATADILNSLVFGARGPVKSLASIFGATGDRAGEGLLQNFIPDGYDKPIFPVSDNEAAAKPLVTGKYNPDLHLALGLLRTFNSELNSTEVGGEPVCNFHSETSEFIKGAGSLPPYSPFYFFFLSKILPKLSPFHANLFNETTTSGDMDKAAHSTFTR